MSASQIEIPHRPLSTAALQRDLSVAVAAESVASIGERVRAALGERADSLEDILVLSQTRCMDLSTSSRRRLALQPARFTCRCAL